MLAKKPNIVAMAMQMKLGGSTYPLPRQVIDIPKPEGLINRAISANTRRISATITNSSAAFISPPRVLVSAEGVIAATWAWLAKNSRFNSLRGLGENAGLSMQIASDALVG